MGGTDTAVSAREHDLVIVGGGLVGGSLACALRGTGLRVAVVEAVAAHVETHPSYDERVIALSWTSRQIFGAMGLWPHVAGGVEPIEQIHVSQRGGCGITRLDYRDEGVAALGFVAPARLLGAAIQGGLAGEKGQAAEITMYAPARVVDVRVLPDWVELEIVGDGQVSRLRASLLVAADGGDSLVRERVGASLREHHYGQSAIIATVTPDRPAPGVAFERFTDSGPLALLPMTEGRWSVVWSALEDQTAELLALSDQDFIARLQERFGFRLGRFARPSRRVAFPLRQRLASEPVAPRVVLVGNAAHTLHPVAGQGFNLGLRDVAALGQVLVDARAAGDDLGGATVRDAYRTWRRHDQAMIAATTDVLARLFVPQWPPLPLARDVGLLGVELLPGLRHLLARRFMGRAGRQTRLARGLPLETNHG